MAYDSENEFHPIVMASDSEDMKAGAFSRISDAVTKGVPAAAVSGGLSIWNTIKGYAGADQTDTGQLLSEIDVQMGDYYKENQGAIDVVGFVGTSIIPGMVGVKALQLARAGSATTTVGRALNLASSRKAYHLEQALQETGASGGVIKGILSQSRLRQLGWEMADQALTATAAELAIAATMNDSPIFNDATAGDFAWNIALGAGLGGIIGGSLASIGAKGILKQAQTQIEGRKRLVDTVFDPSELGLTKGTETLAFAEDIVRLPKEFGDIKFTYSYDGVKRDIVLEKSGAALEAAHARALRTAEQKLTLKFNELAEGNERMGQAYLQFLRNGMQSAEAAGKSADEQIGLIAGYLNNVNAVKVIDVDQMARDAKKFYVSLEPSQGTLDDMFSAKRVPGKTGKTPYMMAEGVESTELKVVKLVDSGFDNPSAAWKAGFDADLIQLPNGRAVVNPKSEKVIKLNDNPNRVRMFVDLGTGDISEEAVVHFADTARKGTVKHSLGGIEANGKFYKQAGTKLTSIADDSIEGSARFAWASQLDIAAFKAATNQTIDTRDLAMLSRFVELSDEHGAAALAQFKIIDGAVTTNIDEIPNLKDFLLDSKLVVLEEQLAKNGNYDLRHIAAHLNMSVDSLEGAIARNFVPPRTNDQIEQALTTADALRPKTAQVEWDFSTTQKLLDPLEAYKQNFGPGFQATRELTVEYQVAIRTQVNRNAANAVLGEDAALFRDAPKDLALDVSQEGAGSGVFTASNAGYDQQAKLWVQDTGKQVALVSQRNVDNVAMTLAPYVNQIRDTPQAAAELGVLTTALRKSEYRYVANPEGGQQLISTEVRRLMASEGVDSETALRMLNVQMQSAGRTARIHHVLDIENQAVFDFLQVHARINSGRQEKFTTLYNAAGQARKPLTENVIYVPPIDTAKYKHIAFVRTKEKIGIASETSVITAHSEQQLRELARQVESDKYDVFFQADTAAYYKAKGEYDYSRTLNETRVNSDLARTGTLADHLPETRAENVLTDYMSFHSREEQKLVRDAVQVKNRQFFSELQFLSDNYRVVSESTTFAQGARLQKKVEDPFGDYVKTALNVSKQQEFPLLDSLNEFVDKLGLAAGDAMQKAFGDAKKGLVSWGEADALAKKFGLGTPYAETNDMVAAYLSANKAVPKNVIKETFQKANMLLANFTLRLDFANSLINIVSTPIMLGTEVSSIKQMFKNQPELLAEVNALMSVKVPGREYAVPSTMKLIADATKNYFGSSKQELMTRYSEIGAIKEVSRLYHDMLDDLAFSPAYSPKTWATKVDGATENLSKFTGNQFSEDFTRFVSADVMRQITEPLVKAGKFSLQDQNAWISTFVNRVQGNYVTSQRPIVFQGTTGGAISLFQTYAFNVLQQLYRHVESRDKRTLMTFAGLQSTVFGFNGLPFFDAVNTHIIGSHVAGNPGHNDAYNVLPAFNKELGDWMLYGSASAFPLFTGSAPALYTRGDINPRHISVLPTNIADVPAVSASLKLADTIYSFGKNMANGADMSDAMLQGLEYQGWNRPLAGFAQLLAGQSTTSKGSLISAANDLQATSWLGALAERTVEYGGAARLMGARPMDEAVALNQMYRNKTYEALDRARLANLGRAVKTKLYNGESPSEEELNSFMTKYASSGGRIENFSQFMQRSMKDANASVINQTAAKLGTSSGRKLQQLMGGEDVPDYWNAPE